MNWQNILKTALVGTERTPLPENEIAALRQLGLQPGDDPTQNLLEALAAAQLLRKAGFPLLDSAEIPLPTPDVSDENLKPCSPQAVRSLELILAGVHAPALGEFLQIMLKNGRRLPTEFLSRILDNCLNNKILFSKIKPLLAGRGAWLAAQNPDWQPLFSVEKIDWETAAFADRVDFFHETRQTNPLLAASFLEKTWPQERPEHKAQFLRLLHTRLGPLDEDLLEKAASDKNKEVRWVAVQLLCGFDSARRERLSGFFAERLAAGLEAGDFEKFLQKNLPDLEEDPVTALVALLPGKEIASHWRLAVYGIFLRLLPGAELEKCSGKTPEKILSALAEPGSKNDVLPALLDGIGFHREENWQAATIHFFSKQPDHPLWKTQLLADILAVLPESLRREQLPALLQLDPLFENSDSALLKVLAAAADQPWPKALLDGFLVSLNRLLNSRSPWSLPVEAYRKILQNAAYQCVPQEAESARAWLLPTPDTRHPWKKELEQFFDTLKFRREMRVSLNT